MPSPLSHKLRELGLELPPVAAPVAAYRPAKRVGDLVFTSGQIPFVDGVLALTGLVGDVVTTEAARDLAQTCVLNCLAAAETVLTAHEVLVDVVRIGGYVASATGYTDQAQVVDGASVLLDALFPDGHARTSIGVKELPLSAPVEIELVATVGHVS